MRDKPAREIHHASMGLEARREPGKQNETEFGLQEAVMVAARQLGEQ
jgi:hypothetical protein